MEPCHSVHAEANALLSGERSTWQGGTMYITKHPCMECAKFIANSGIAYIVVSPNPPVIAEERHVTVYNFLGQCGVVVELIDPPMPAIVLHMTARDD
jgi:deoxycytidylate deaminase